MTKIEVDQIGIKYDIRDRVPKTVVEIPMLGTVNDDWGWFTGTFLSGSVTCLLGHVGDGGSAISYALSGMISIDYGTIMMNDKSLSSINLANIGQVVWFSSYSRRCFRKRKRTVREQLENALAKGNPYGVNGLEDLIDKFMLNPERLDRPLEYYSGERWRASAAIAFAEGKRIFSFPWLNPGYIRNDALWLPPMLDVLRAHNAWIIIPTADPDCLSGGFDSIVNVTGRFNSK